MSSVTTETSVPLMRFMGATHATTKLTMLPSFASGLTSVPNCQDGIQRHSVEFGERGKQIYGIECGAKYGHDQCTGNAGKDGIFLSFLKGIHSGSGDDQAAAHHEVRQIADESGRRTFYDSFSSIFTNSIMTPATGPKAKEPTKIGSSLKSIL